MEWLGDFLNNLWASLVDLVRAYWDAFTAFLTDLPIRFIDGLLGALATLIEALPRPDFLSEGLSTLFAGMGGGIMFFLAEFKVPEALALVGAAFAFRFLRRVLTLGIW
mgnify:CR=1 FL=1